MTEQTADHSDEGDVSNATPEGDIPDATPDEDVQETDTPEGSDFKSEQDPETFPREYVEKLPGEESSRDD